MTIAPFTDDQDVQRRTFRALRVLRDALQEEGLWLPTLSMGMSADYGVAVEEGAKGIRLGTVLFGPRERAATGAATRSTSRRTTSASRGSAAARRGTSRRAAATSACGA